ncbi:hypothetical protein NW768_011571 [Fusarium equiseti]|uniref:Uncharacterized protein n=1 Tax=Fusarium equiseti TaxID=61235 RepID=A0ABQ8QX88_FUSEQ|nr:hypothetical protein NW768_011571 [Fusarium equiseti]
MAQPPENQKQALEWVTAASSAENESPLASTSESGYVTQTLRITRQEALEKGGDLIYTVLREDVEQNALGSHIKDLLDVHTFRVLPIDVKRRVIW